MLTKIQKAILGIFILIFTGTGFSGELSSATRRIIRKYSSRIQNTEMQKSQSVNPFNMGVPIHDVAGQPAVRSLLKVSTKSVESQLIDLGVRIDRKVEDIWSVTVPLAVLSELERLEKVVWVEVDTPVKKRLDAAGKDVLLNRVHLGEGLPRAYMGDGVLIGIVDGGFDYTHPVFKSQGGSLRIHSIWDQSDFSGSPPDGFAYGSLLTTEADILNKEHDMPEGLEYATHGTHVAGIAAGRAADAETRFGGMAPGAELIFVTLSGGPTDIMDAVDYIFETAEAAGKPAVINMSLGSHLGPHDGSSLLDQYFDKKAGAGKIMVGSAGNEGDSDLHLTHLFSGDTIATAPELLFDEYSDTDQGVVELWGSVDGSFEISVGLFDDIEGVLVYESDYFSSDLNDYFEDEGVSDEGGSIAVSGGAVRRNPNNGKPNIQVEISNGTDYDAVLIVTAASGSVHLWNATETPFTDLGYSGPLLAGDNDYSVGEIGGTSKSLITVGAYTTKTQFDAVDGKTYIPDQTAGLGELAPFSSRGPSVDGRIKPDITAPGNIVTSAISSKAFTDEAEMEAFIDLKWPMVPWPGTSMASPMVAGIIALMLEANPALTRDQIMDIFSLAARSDAHTGAIPAGGSNQWGLGKIDALAAVQEVLGISDVKNEGTLEVTDYTLAQNYPNPFNPLTEIRFALPVAGHVKLSLYDLKGRQVLSLFDGSKSAGHHVVTVDAHDLASGLYVYRIETERFSKQRKMMLIK